MSFPEAHVALLATFKAHPNTEVLNAVHMVKLLTNLGGSLTKKRTLVMDKLLALPARNLSAYSS